MHFVELVSQFKIVRSSSLIKIVSWIRLNSEGSNLCLTKNINANTVTLNQFLLLPRMQ